MDKYLFPVSILFLAIFNGGLLVDHLIEAKYVLATINATAFIMCVWALVLQVKRLIKKPTA